MFTHHRGFKWTLTEASLMLPSPAASLAILLMMGETLVGPYSWILGRQFWYASTTPWISDQKEKTAETQLAAVKSHVWQHLSDNRGLSFVRFCTLKKKSEWSHHWFYIHIRAWRNGRVLHRFLSWTTRSTGRALPSHSSSSGLKLMAKSWETCRRGRGGRC